jgi:hypothetical protein
LGHALNDLEYPKFFCWKGLFILFGELYLFFVILTRSPTLNLARPSGFLALRLFIFCQSKCLKGLLYSDPYLLWNVQICCNPLKYCLWHLNNGMCYFLWNIYTSLFSKFY